jgi:hypothetical protein
MGGGVYCCAAFNEYLNQKGISRRLSVARTPQQNGRSERLNRTSLCIVRCILENAGLPKPFWGEAVLTAINITNCCPSRVIQGKIPIEVWSKKAFTIVWRVSSSVAGATCLPPSPSLRGARNRGKSSHAPPRFQHEGCGSYVTRRSSSDVLCAVSSN